jgi:eukaryotic-like serine/threonine-protein kinase
LGGYEVVRPLGAGGMGEVYLARDTTLDRMVALKLLPVDVTSDSQRVARFEREARSASALSHPNVCVVHALGATEDGRRFIAMEYVEGRTLRDRLSRGHVDVALRDVLDIGVQVAAAVGAAHALGIVHRDLKPENVMVRPDGLVKVLDFGLAKLAPPDPLGPTIDDPTRAHLSTAAGIIVGTVSYMSPEQIRGLEVDARTDIWSLGVVLYELTTGRRPFVGSSGSDVMVAILEREPVPLAQFNLRLPAELQRIVGKALRKDREQRYQVIKDLRLDLEAFRDELSLHARSSAVVSGQGASRTDPTAEQHQSSAEYLVRQIGRHKAAATLVLGVVMVLASLVGWWALRSAHSQARRQESAAPGQRTLTRLTFGSGLQADPTFSPDSRFIAYSSDRLGNADIWVQPVGGGDPVQVTRSPAQDTQPAWSPDGSSLVFRSERDGGGLYIVPALGGVERQLTSFGTNPSWSPGMPEIMFLQGIAPGDAGWPTRLFTVSPAEGVTREILPGFLGRGAWFWIGRHPDGRVSAWGRHNKLGPGFFTVALNGREVVASREAEDSPVRISEGGTVVSRRFQWHPTGTALYVQTETDGVYNFWRVRIDPRTLAWVSADRLTTGPGSDVSPALSPDGTRLAFVTERHSSRLWAYPLNHANRSVGSGEPLTEDDATAEFGSISPDGRRLAYNLRRPGSRDIELRVVGMAGGPSELLGINAIGPLWSPDGTALAYSYFRLNLNPIAARLAIRQIGGQERFLTDWRNDLVFSASDWNARGLLGTQMSASLTGDAPLVLWSPGKLGAATPDRVLVSVPNAQAWQAKWSPKGRWVSFVLSPNDRPGTSELTVARADGAPDQPLIRIAGEHTWPDKPRWSPDGRTLYFISPHRAPYFNLWGVGFDADRGAPVGEPFTLTAFDSPALHISPHVQRAEMEVSAQHVVLTMKAVSGSIWMLDGVDR